MKINIVKSQDESGRRGPGAYVLTPEARREIAPLWSEAQDTFNRTKYVVREYAIELGESDPFKSQRELASGLRQMARESGFTTPAPDRPPTKGDKVALIQSKDQTVSIKLRYQGGIKITNSNTVVSEEDDSED